jgi:hypothetical protein
MKTLAFALIALLLFAAPVPLQSAQVTWRAAETAPETPEENRAHAEGRAVDINEVNKMPVRFAIDKNAPPDRRDAVRAVLKSMEAQLRSDVQVKAFVSPIGGFHRDSQTRTILREATQAELDAHWDHIHIETFD